MYRRQFADREEAIVNLLQFPADGLIYAVRPTELPPVGAVVVSWPAALVLPADSQNQSYLKPATENPTDAFAMSPDAPDQAPVPLTVKRVGDRFAVTVPAVQTWTMLLVRRNYPGYDRPRFVKGQAK